MDSRVIHFVLGMYTLCHKLQPDSTKSSPCLWLAQTIALVVALARCRSSQHTRSLRSSPCVDPRQGTFLPLLPRPTRNNFLLRGRSRRTDAACTLMILARLCTDRGRPSGRRGPCQRSHSWQDFPWGCKRRRHRAARPGPYRRIDPTSLWSRCMPALAVGCSAGRPPSYRHC